MPFPLSPSEFMPAVNLKRVVLILVLTAAVLNCNYRRGEGIDHIPITIA